MLIRHIATIERLRPRAGELRDLQQNGANRMTAQPPPDCASDGFAGTVRDYALSGLFGAVFSAPWAADEPAIPPPWPLSTKAAPTARAAPRRGPARYTQ